MKNVRVFILKSCPYCKAALRWLEELRKEDARYAALPVEIIDENEQKALADSLDYYLVPTIYVGDKKVHEGAATKDKIRRALDAAL